MLNEVIGSRVTVDDVDVLDVPAGSQGYALYGPYDPYPPGRYNVRFSLEPVGGEASGLCAVVEVTADFGTRDIAFAPVFFEDLKESGVELGFDLDTTETLEFRVFVCGAAPIRVADRTIVTLRREASPTPFSDIPVESRGLLKHLWTHGVPIAIDGPSAVVPVHDLLCLADTAATYPASGLKLARRVVETVGFSGDPNSLYRAFVGSHLPAVSPPQPVPFRSSLCQQVHFGYDQYRYWTRALKEAPMYQRKQWEFVFIAQALFERGCLVPGRRGLAFGAGEEQLPALFASFGAAIVATDQAPADAVQGGWSQSGQHTYNVAALNQRSICTDRMFGELVRYRPVDMNNIPSDLDDQFDFCWSACAFEHLGSIAHGLDFVMNAMKTLRPGGVAVHTTEYNLSSNEQTIESEHLSIYRRRDIDCLITKLTDAGFEVSPVDWALGEGFAESVVDLPPFSGYAKPHIRLRADQYDVTSLGLIIQRPASAD